MISKLIQKKQKGFHFILRETTNKGMIEAGFVGERFVIEELPELFTQATFKGRKGKQFSISVNNVVDLDWCGNLDLVQKAKFRIGIGTEIQSKNSRHILQLVDVVQ